MHTYTFFSTHKKKLYSLKSNFIKYTQNYTEKKKKKKRVIIIASVLNARFKLVYFC